MPDLQININDRNKAPPFKSAEGPPYIMEDVSVPPFIPKDRNEVKTHSEKFETLVGKSTRVLFRAKTVFPFKFFTDYVIIDENKVNLIHTIFFFSIEVQSILIHHIKDVIADTDILDMF